MKLKEVRLNQHQTHMEDLVLLGEEGINEFNDKINRFKRSLEGEDSGLNTTTKIDGAPAVVVWHTFEGLPNNSICLKSFMTPNPKVLSSIEDIENTYGDRPTMATMLAYCLELSKYIPDGQAWQGDCLFINRTLKEREINDTSYLTFQPNKIIYAFSENNPGYEEVKNAEFGIAFHTIYTGNKEHKSQSFRVNAKELNAPSKFYILSPALNASSSKENYNLAELDNLQSKFNSQSEALLSDNSYNELINNKEFMGYWNTFENANLADKQATNINVNTFINDLKEYIDDKLEKEYNKKLGTLKTDKGRERALLNRNDSISRLNSIVENNKQTLVNLVNCLNTASDIKMLLWEGFKKTKTDYSTFYQSKTRGYLNADPEGIAMSDSDGNIVKIVDRSTFSSHNRDNDYTSGFDHQNEELECFNIYNEELQEVEPSWSKFESLLEGIKKLAVVGFGRMNPPTIGHEKLINKIHEVASKNGGKPLFYLSHTQDKKKNPLSYEDKLSWCRKAFGDKVELPNSNAKTMIDVLRELDSDGYTDIVYVGGGDRIGGAEDVTQMLLRYNGQPTKTGEIIYDFNSIDFVNAGDRSDDSEDITSRASASLAREYVKNNDFDNFSKIVPFNEEDAKELFDTLRRSFDIKENYYILKEKRFSNGEEYKHNYFNDVINFIINNKYIALGDKGETVVDLHSFLTDSKIKELKSLLNTPNVQKFNSIMLNSGVSWTKIFKGAFSLKSRQQGDVESLIAYAFNNIEDEDLEYHKIAKVLAESIGFSNKTGVTIHKLANKDGGRPTEEWRKFGAYGDSKIDYTPKTDLLSSDNIWKISLKEAKGSQLMSGKLGNSSGEALATLNSVIDKMPKERYTLDSILNVEPGDDDIDGAFNVNEVLKDFYEDDFLHSPEAVISDIKRGRSGTEEQRKKLLKISKQLDLFANKLQNLCTNDEEFRKAFLKEAATGQTKFGYDSISTANCWFVYNNSNSTAEFYDSWDSFYNNYINSDKHNIKILVNFKSGGTGSIPWIVIRVLEN